MCTLIALHRIVPELPLALAANRDEYLDRPAQGPALRQSGGRPVVAPRDLRAGGSWLGLNDAGLFVGLTNRPTPAPDPQRRSRGMLVMEALAAGSASEAARALESLPANAYNPFNLLLADGRDAFCAVYEDKAAISELAPGAHVIGNADPDDPHHPKTARLLEGARDAAELPAAKLTDALAALCRGHEGDGGRLSPTCVHTEGYGTRSSTLLLLGRDAAARRLYHAEGPPCRVGYEDRTYLLRELGVSPPARRGIES